MKVSVTLDFLNIEQLYVILQEKINAYNKHWESNIIYLENSKYNFLHQDLGIPKDKTKLIEYIERVCDDYHCMVRFVLDEMNCVITSRDKHTETHRTRFIPITEVSKEDKRND